MTKKGISTDTKGNIHVDDAFLQSYIDKGGQVQTSAGTPVDSADALLSEVGKGEKSATRSADALHKEVEQKQGPVAQKQSKEDARVQKQAEAAAKRIAKSQISQAQQVVSGIKKATDPAIRKAGHFTDRFSRARTVGGIGLLVIILVFLLMIVVEVNTHGDTRIKQLWYMLNGRAALIGRRIITPNATPQSSNTSSLQNQTDAVALQNAGLSIVDPTGVLPALNGVLQSFRPGNNLGF